MLISLAILLALAAPFLLSMGHGEAAAAHSTDELQVAWSAESMRDYVLHEAALGHRSTDKTPLVDGLDEFPGKMALPKAFAALGENGLQLLAGESWDVQRRINLNSATPLVLANLLGTVTRLSGDHTPEANELLVEDASRFPQHGWVLADRELIEYAQRDGSKLTGLKRGLLLEKGFRSSEGHAMLQGMLVLDWRVVLACTYPFNQRHEGDTTRWEPYGSVDELVRIGEAGFGTFAGEEMDVLRRTLTTASVRENACEWGKPERLFSEAKPGTTAFQVRSSQFLAGGTVIRVRTLDGKKQEHALVWSTESIPGPLGIVNLSNRSYVQLVGALTQDFPDQETVVEPLVPHPVNINTASAEVLTALAVNLRQALRQRPQTPEDRQKWKGFEPAFSPTEAKAFSSDVVAMRPRTPGNDTLHPFDSFEDLEKRLFKPRFLGADEPTIRRWSNLYRNLLNGRDAGVEQATMPICFMSAPIVAYRASAARNKASGALAARRELFGYAATMPGTSLDVLYLSQDSLEEAFRLDRQAPWYLTWPMNTGAGNTADVGTNPVSRHPAHLFADAFPQAGFGQPRFPSRDVVLSGFRSASAVGMPQEIYRGRDREHESMSMAQDPDGRDITVEGPYRIVNSGPTGKKSVQPANNRDHSRIDFPISTRGGVVARHATAFWFKLKDLSEQCLYDLSADLPDRNRISLRIEKQHLVFEVLDEAGVDPEPQLAQTQVQRSGATWKLALKDANLEQDVWYHASLSAEGSRPGQITFLLDGVKRGEPMLRTYLTSVIGEYKRDQQSTRPAWELKELHPLIRVESTEGFPPQGVLRIGLELFEYSSIDGNTFITEYIDSLGGRVARMDVSEYIPNIPVDAQGRPTKSIEELLRSGNLDVAPQHPAGAAVELYGYSLPLYRESILQPSSTKLSSSIGAFSVARVGNRSNLKDIVAGAPPGPFARPGRGLDAGFNDDLELADPIPSPKGGSYPPPQASEAVCNGFARDGGYALLVQAHLNPTVTEPPLTGSVRIEVGGLELIRYGSRQGAKLRGIQRGQTLPGLAGGTSGRFTGRANNYVLDWYWAFGPRNGPYTPGNELASVTCYVVPISLPVANASNLADPTLLGYVEWIQIYDGKGDAENETEWVRYDRVLDNRHVVRANMQAWLRLYQALTGSTNVFSGSVSGGSVNDPRVLDYGKVLADTLRHIGYTDRIEVDFPAVWVARRGLDFRGDSFTGTTSHKHESNAIVLPVHRMELDWGNYGALSARSGRNDRVALVNGVVADGDARPAVEWHTVNWECRRAGFDDPKLAADAEKLGPWPFQLVAFKEGVKQLFTGPSARDDQADPRFLDRLVKFPSGELPAAYCENAVLGGAAQKDWRNARGIIDEIDIVGHNFPNSPSPLALVLDEPLTLDARTFQVQRDAALTSIRLHGQKGIGEQFPPKGGLVRIDGELVAYASCADGKFEVARNGRGLLGSEVKAHDEGALVYFLDQVPCAILTAGVQPGSSSFAVSSLNELPKYGGTLLLGTTELLHYSWTCQDDLIEMPRWRPPESTDGATRGLLRGRFGTKPVSAASGEPLIWFPIRFWDRWHERADDPELSHFQITLQETPVFFTALTWEIEKTDALVELHCMMRIDGRGRWSDDPKATPGLFAFTQGKVDDKPNPVHFQGSRAEVRFLTKYRDGAFDSATYRQNAWKSAPMCKVVGLSFEGESHILSEQVSAR